MDAFVVHRGNRRKARGFTCAEACEAGILTCEDIKKFNIPLDPFRKTKYAENVKTLKSLLKK